MDNFRETGNPLSAGVSVIGPSREKAWDDFVASHPDGWICDSTGWKRILEECFPHVKGYLLAVTDKNATIQAGLALYSVTSRLTGRRLVSVPFATLSDPLISDDAQWNALIGATDELSKQCRADYLEIRTNRSKAIFPPDRFGVIDAYRQHAICLEGDLDKIQRSFDRTCVRQRISRAEKSGVAVFPVSTETELKEFYRLYLISRKRIRRPPQAYPFIRALWRHFGPESVSVRLARYQNRNVAGILLLRYGKRVSAEFLVMDESYLAASPGHLLFWDAIQEAWAQKYRVFDFGRTAVNNHPLMEYKKRWGTAISPLPIYISPSERATAHDRMEDSIKFRAIQYFSEKLPVPLFASFGDFCYRHMH